MNRLVRMKAPLLAALLVLESVELCAQAQVGFRPFTDSIVSSHFPGAAAGQIEKLGKRLQSAETGRVQYLGSVKDSRGTRPIEITLQNPGWVRIVEGGPASRVGSFDGARVDSSTGSFESSQMKMLETLLLDSPEGFFQQIALLRPLRKIGGGFLVKNAAANSKGEELVDVFQLLPSESTGKVVGSVNSRMIGFDSISGLLRYTSYRDAAGNAISSQFLQWTTVNGESYPTVIRRVENGVEIFQIAVQTLSVSPAAGKGGF